MWFGGTGQIVIEDQSLRIPALEEQVGNIEVALDNIIAIQEGLIGTSTLNLMEGDGE